MLTNAKNEIYFQIYQNSNPDFNLKISKKSIDIILKLYGEEIIPFRGFIIYSLEKKSSIIIHQQTMKKELDDSEANHISERLNNLGKYFIIPESLKSLDEEKQYELAIKTSGKYITHIMEKAGIDLDSMIYYIGLQIITQEITEKVVIDYYTFEKIFSKIYFLTVKYKDKKNTDISFYSYRQILKNCGIKLEEILPYLHIDIKNNKREIINYNINDSRLYKGVQIRQLKELISPEMNSMNMDLEKGTEPIKRIEKINFDDLEIYRNEESNLLKDLIEQINKKKEEIKKICEDENYQIIEIKNNNNEIFYITKKNYDKLIKSTEENNDNNSQKIKDVYDNELEISKLDLKENKNIIDPYIKIFNNNNKNDFILMTKEDLYNKLTNFKYIRQKDNFKGKSINGEQKEFEGLFMELQYGKFIEKNEPKSNEKIESNDKLLESRDNKKNIEITNLNDIIKSDFDFDFNNIINPYTNHPFNQIRVNSNEESKNEDDKNEEKLKNIPESDESTGERKTYRIRRAIIFKRPAKEKE